MTRVLMVGASASGSGKTLVTAALARAFCHQGLKVATAKCGPDYLDPCFHAFASRRPCFNLDPWSMSYDELLTLAHDGAEGADLLLIEGVMGLFDGAAQKGRNGASSSAALAKALNLPIILIVKAAGNSQSLAATALGFSVYDPDLRIVGVIANQVASPRHEALINDGFKACHHQSLPPLLACFSRQPSGVLPARHLGLVQAQEISDLETRLDDLAQSIAKQADLARFFDLSVPLPEKTIPSRPFIRPPGQSIAVASDKAFAFAYPHLLKAWQSAGATLYPFSPLADETPEANADIIYLPGGYPELSLEVLSRHKGWQTALHKLARQGCPIYGECGGFMVLGQIIYDETGRAYPMSGLLDCETSFATDKRQLHLGYRHAELLKPAPFGEEGQMFRCHEYHYSTTVMAQGEPLFRYQDQISGDFCLTGLCKGSVQGSFFHLIAGDAP